MKGRLRTAEFDRELTDLWLAGHSTAEIGRRLDVTKNAIIGRAHRLDLPARGSPIKYASDRPDPVERPLAEGMIPVTDELVAQIKQMRESGLSYQKIQLATGVYATTAHGLYRGVRPRAVKDARLRDQPDAPLVMAVRPVFLAPKSIQQVLPFPKGRVSKAPCCWPIGEPGKRNFRYCDGPSMLGKPYCVEHCIVAYVKVKTPTQLAGERSVSA